MTKSTNYYLRLLRQWNGMNREPHDDILEMRLIWASTNSSDLTPSVKYLNQAERLGKKPEMSSAAYW